MNRFENTKVNSKLITGFSFMIAMMGMIGLVGKAALITGEKETGLSFA